MVGEEFCAIVQESGAGKWRFWTGIGLSKQYALYREKLCVVSDFIFIFTDIRPVKLPLLTYSLPEALSLDLKSAKTVTTLDTDYNLSPLRRSWALEAVP